MRAALSADVGTALRAGEHPLACAAEAIRGAFAVDRVSIARIDGRGGRFEIAADAGAELLAPGTALPVSTCSYFARVAEGRAFHDEDFDASRTFRLPLDSVVLATGFHSGCSVPVRRSGHVIGALSLSASAPGHAMGAFLDALDALGDVVAPAIARGTGARAAQVLVCHSDALAGRGIARLVEAGDDAGARVATTLAAAIAAAADAPPDVVVCDDWLDGLRVDEVAAALRAAGVEAPLLVVSSRDAPENVRASLLAGAAAHISRCNAVAALPRALEALRGGRALPAVSPPGGEPRLTARERELLGCLEQGLRFKQAAVQLSISEATAKTHARNLFRKLDATSRAEAVHAAREGGLLA